MKARSVDVDEARLRSLRLLDGARAAVYAATLGALARAGGHLGRAVPGPWVVRGLTLSVIGGVAAAAITALFILPAHRVVGRGELSASTELADLSVRLVVLSVCLFVLWLIVGAVGSPIVVPIGTALIVLISDSGLGLGLAHAGAEGEPFDDPSFGRRLARFAREVGIGPIDCRRATSNTGSTASTMSRAPDLMMVGTTMGRRVVMIPPDLVGAGIAVVEHRLAREMIRFRRGMFSTVLRSTLVTLVVILPFVRKPDAILRWAGVPTLSDPGSVPVILLVVVTGVAVARVLQSPLVRRMRRRELAAILDLTRDPDAALASVGYDVRHLARSARRSLYDTLRGELSLSEVQELVERWKRERRVCLLFTDVENSTINLNRLGDEGWYEVLSNHDHVVREAMRTHGGTEIDKPGDGFLITFTDSGRAVLAAIEMQRRLVAVEVSPGQPIAVRMGLHAGEVIRRGRELVGREVHLAARVGAQAVGGEILVSRDLADELASSGRFRFGEARRAVLKGFDGEHEVVPVLWDEASEEAVAV